MMTENEIKRIVEETVEATLLRLGVDLDDPIEVQRDMSFLRDWRTSTAAVKRHGIFTAIGILVAAGLGLVWLAIRGGH
jgi:hypothetical protein